MTGRLGIFWGIPDPDRRWAIVIDASLLAVAEPYGDFLTHSRGHYEIWEEWQRLRPAALTKRSVPPIILDHEYEDFPRGRIVYDTKTKLFIVYADRRLQHPNTIKDITERFDILPSQFVVRSDAHYRS